MSSFNVQKVAAAHHAPKGFLVVVGPKITPLIEIEYLLGMMTRMITAANVKATF
jgi:hypothetical protein